MGKVVVYLREIDERELSEDGEDPKMWVRQLVSRALDARKSYTQHPEDVLAWMIGSPPLTERAENEVAPSASTPTTRSVNGVATISVRTIDGDIHTCKSSSLEQFMLQLRNGAWHTDEAGRMINPQHILYIELLQ